ncbi:MAG: FKBP-type peptidyl-prolyl cis-trans isomerase [Bacteroidota bacterium]
MSHMKLESLKQMASYALGVNVANSLKQQNVSDIDADAFAKAVADIYGGETPLISGDQANQAINQFLGQLQSAGAAANIEKSKKFLADNGQRAEVTVLESGLQYEVLTEGSGPRPKATDKVTTHYHGTLIDGSVFDSSVERGQPASFPVNGVIQGWQEALQLMPQGSKWKLYIPADLAYGNRGAGGKIGPGTALIFEVELLSID